MLRENGCMAALTVQKYLGPIGIPNNPNLKTPALMTFKMLREIGCMARARMPPPY
jgi:hypothetical protein